MTRIEPELERTVRGWLEDGVSTLPDHVFDAVVAQAPLIRQRRMGWWPPDPSTARLLAALAAVIVLAVTLVGFLLGTNVGDDDSDSTWRVFPVVQEAPLEPGRYLIDDPFPVRIGLTIPGGWTANPTRATQAELGRDGGGAGLVFTIVEGVYADPCHNDRGLIDPPVGPTVDDLVAALAGLPGITVSGPSDTTIGGLPAVTMTLTAPSVTEGCTAEPQAPLFKLWGVPEWHELGPGQRNRLWVVGVGDTRLVIAAIEDEDSTPSALADLNVIISSIDLDPAILHVVEPSEAPAPSLRALPQSGPVPPGDYWFEIRLHRIAGDVSIPLANRHRIQTTVAEGWSSVGSGVERPLEQPTVGVSAWDIGRIYPDPCHWQSDDLDPVDGAQIQTLAELSEALSRGWRADPSRSGFDAGAGLPITTDPMDKPQYGRFGRYVELTVPEDVDLASCDGGEYRLWEDSLGRPRSARGAGEQIRVYVVDADPGLLTVDAWSLPSASDDDLQALEEHLFGMWLFDPEPATEE